MRMVYLSRLRIFNYNSTIPFKRFINSTLKMNFNIGEMRTSYRDQEDEFKECHLVSKEPISQFRNWFEAACAVEGIGEPNAMCLSTATRDGKPSARMVLLKGFSKDGFIFFTNYDSRKGHELAENPFAALTFFWEPLHRSVRIEGMVEKLSQEESNEYFLSRPRPKQISACVSPQSQPIASKEVLIEKFNKLDEEYKNSNESLKKPPNWGGFKVVPQVIEFWQGQTSRLHDRIQFRLINKESKFAHKGTDGWVYERLAP